MIIYTTWEFYKRYLTQNFTNNPIWIRDIQSTPQLDDGREWLFWQYTNRGELEGIQTLVDLNVFSGTRNEFENLMR